MLKRLETVKIKVPWEDAPRCIDIEKKRQKELEEDTKFLMLNLLKRYIGELDEDETRAKFLAAELLFREKLSDETKVAGKKWRWLKPQIDAPG